MNKADAMLYKKNKEQFSKVKPSIVQSRNEEGSTYYMFHANKSLHKTAPLRPIEILKPNQNTKKMMTSKNKFVSKLRYSSNYNRTVKSIINQFGHKWMNLENYDKFNYKTKFSIIDEMFLNKDSIQSKNKLLKNRTDPDKYRENFKQCLPEIHAYKNTLEKIKTYNNKNNVNNFLIK
jgi:hypothetical protein